MALIEIKDFKGMATKADPADLGLNYSQVTQNFFLDTPGTLVKNPGRGSAAVFTLDLTDAEYWSPSNLNLAKAVVPQQWIGYDLITKKLTLIDADVFNSTPPTPIGMGSAYSANLPTDFDYQDHGNEFRISPNNLEHPPKFLSHISRKFFGDAYDHSDVATGYRVDDFVFQDAFPIAPTNTQLAPGIVSVLASTGGMSVENNKTYNYKFSPVYDGVQELPLGESYITKSVTEVNSALQVPFIIYAGYSSSPSGTAPNKTYPIDPRMTSVKVYRETDNSGTYFHVGGIPISRSSETAILDEPVSKSNVLSNKKAIYSDYFIDNYSSLISSTGIFSCPDVVLTADNVTLVRWYYALRTNTTSSRGADLTSYDKGQVLWISGSSVVGTNGTAYTATFNNGPLDNNQFKADLQKGFINIDERNGASSPGVILNETSQTLTSPHYIFNDGSTSIITKWLYYETSTNGGTSHAIGPAAAGVSTHTEHQNVLNICWHDRGLIFPEIANDKRWSKNQANSLVVYKDNFRTVVEESIGKAVKAISNSQFGTLQHPYVNVPIIDFTEGVGALYAAKTKIDLKSGISHGLSTGDSISITGCVRGDFNGTFTVTVANPIQVYIDYAYDQNFLDQDVFGSNTVFNVASSQAKVSNFVQKSFSSTTQFVFIDTGLSNGSPQPYADGLKVQTHYKYSQMIGDRLFVGNVRLDPNGDAEDHPDWVVYSESGMPDVLPPINYIQIKDQQGGRITGMNKILDSLVVFMTRGTFRLDVASSASPATWSLMESDKNTGCIAPNSIISVKDNLFFASNDNIYQISPDFRMSPITLPIKDKYQETANLEETRLFYDVARDRIICRFGLYTTEFYVFNLSSQLWTTIKFTDVNIGPPKFFTKAEDLEVYAIRGYEASGESGGGGMAGG